mmetsp:Transcript_5143/g.5278  ORF Transcript_5143/g.5278 Transcript_5143/m.5278 type:complete len:332 (+) Transcript_5143:143-1138(+)
MITQSEILASLLYFTILYPIIIFTFRGDNSLSKRRCLWTALIFIVAGLAIKLGYEMQHSEKNLYSILEVSRHDSALNIRQSYKKLSKKLHPDKNPSPDAELMFQQVKVAYDVLMDESQRDIYNRFGSESLAFDPRLDELKLLSSLGAVYLFWIVSTYIFTIPIAARASRTWIAVFGIGLLVLEISLCLTESSLPEWMPATLTEQELMRRLHSAFPAIIAALATLATSMYVDIDKTSIAVLEELAQHQKALNGVLHQLQTIISVAGDKTQSQDDISAESVANKLTELRDIMDHSGESTTNIIETLKNSSSNPGSNYYWLIFVLLYGGVYFFQ